MEKQNYKNHKQIVYNYYWQTGIPALVIMGIGMYKMTNSNETDNEWGFILLAIGWTLLSLVFRSRGFALKAQDRAIRAEESLRYYLLAGKPLDKQITLQQIIALRFASDEEMVTLAQRSVDENLSADEIKRSIKNWRADTYRV